MKTALIFLADGFEECEALCVLDTLRRAKVQVITASIKDRVVYSSHNVPLTADRLLEELTPDNWDVMFLPGGMPGATNLRDDKRVEKFLRYQYDRGKIVSAICASPAVVFGPLGFLENKEATCFPSCNKYYPDFKFSNKGVVVSQNVVTAKSAGWAFDLGLTLIELLFDKDISKSIQDQIYYKE